MTELYAMCDPDLAAAPLSAAAVSLAASRPLLLSLLAVMGSPGPGHDQPDRSRSALRPAPLGRYLVGVTAGTDRPVGGASGVTVTLLVVPGLRAVPIVPPPPTYAVLPASPPRPPLPAQQAAARHLVHRRAVPRCRQPQGLSRSPLSSPAAALSTAVTTHGQGAAHSHDRADRPSRGSPPARPEVPLLRHPVRSRVINAALAAGLIGATALAIIH
jgi:hypothetical protein